MICFKYASWNVFKKINKMILLFVKKMVNMVNTCAVTNCASGYTKGLKKAFFHFPEDVELKKSGFILLTLI